MSHGQSPHEGRDDSRTDVKKAVQQLRARFYALGPTAVPALSVVSITVIGAVATGNLPDQLEDCGGPGACACWNCPPCP
jgi:hypothetical protein